jgi:UDPglucose 6-dehydrogenase
MYRIGQKIGANWEDAIAGFELDGRIGKSHLTVPGFDGKLGYGGSCFPKDVQAMVNFSKNLGATANTVESSWKTNLEVRPEKDWELLEGRAISEK